MRGALMVNKALKIPSSCVLHPKYAAMRKPTSANPACTCMEIWEGRRGRAIELTEEQARWIWSDKFEDAENFENLYQKINSEIGPKEMIVGIGSTGSSEPKDQKFLIIEKTNGDWYTKEEINEF